jgi:hypothetical protein
MNILGRHVLFRRKPVTELSQFASVLPRIRAIREEYDWQPLTSSSATQHRRERVRTAQQNIIYHPVPYDRGLTLRLPLRRTWWLWLTYGLAVLCASALVWAFTFKPSNQPNYVFKYRLAAAPPFLSEHLALEKAKASLSNVVSDAHLWQPMKFSTARRAPDGTQELYWLRVSATQGSITFSRSDQSNISWAVYVQLFGSNVQCNASMHTINKR